MAAQSLARSSTRSAIGVLVLALAIAGCGSIGSTRSAVPTATPATPRPTVSRAPAPQTVAIAAFVEGVAAGTLSYRVAFEGHASASADTLPITGSMDVSGSDFATSFTYDFSREYDDLGKIRVQVRGVKGKGYIKRANYAWKAIKSFDLADSYVPFKAVKTVKDVRYLGPIEIGGRTYHRVGIGGALLIHPNTIPFDIQKEKIDDLSLEIVLDDAGRPRRGTWKLRGQARVGASGGQLQRVVYELDLQFSKVGDKLTIKKP